MLQTGTRRLTDGAVPECNSGAGMRGPVTGMPACRDTFRRRPNAVAPVLGGLVFVPKLYSTLQTYDRAQFLGDAAAGVIVGIVALPLAIAFAIASGVSPDRGLWTAIIAGFLISALGGSRVQIGGPTGAFVVIVYGIVQKYGIDGLTVATVMAGVILVVMGLARFGDAITFIPHPLVTGFTSGIALIILSGEVKDFFGLHMGIVPAHFLAKWQPTPRRQRPSRLPRSHWRSSCSGSVSTPEFPGPSSR